MLLIAQNSVAQKEMSYSEFVKIKDVSQQRQVFANLPGENQYRLWISRFEALKQLDFSKEELQHINAFQSFIENNKNALFISPNENSLEDLNVFTERWQNDAK